MIGMSGSGIGQASVCYGHGVCGSGLEAGKEVAELREGDLVSGETHIFCGSVFSAGQATRTSARTCVYEGWILTDASHSIMRCMRPVLGRTIPNSLSSG